jgi:hypothetical protein
MSGEAKSSASGGSPSEPGSLPIASNQQNQGDDDEYDDSDNPERGHGEPGVGVDPDFVHATNGTTMQYRTAINRAPASDRLRERRFRRVPG